MTYICFSAAALAVFILAQIGNYAYLAAWRKAHQAEIADAKRLYGKGTTLSFRGHILIHNFCIFGIWASVAALTIAVMVHLFA